MAASIQLSPTGAKIMKITVVSRTGMKNRLAVEQIPCAGYRMPLAMLINLWQFYSHMQGKTYPTVEAFLDDAHPGWQSWQEDVLLPIMTNAQETAVVKAALKNAGIRPKSIRHYLGPVVIVMGREEACEGISYSGNFMEKQRPAMKNSVGLRVD
jgi:hypothetical protein